MNRRNSTSCYKKRNEIKRIDWEHRHQRKSTLVRKRTKLKIPFKIKLYALAWRVTKMRVSKMKRSVKKLNLYEKYSIQSYPAQMKQKVACCGWKDENIRF